MNLEQISSFEALKIWLPNKDGVGSLAKPEKGKGGDESYNK